MKPGRKKPERSPPPEPAAPEEQDEFLIAFDKANAIAAAILIAAIAVLLVVTLVFHLSP